MINREKFKEVFGLEIDEMAADLCDIVDHRICINANDCPSCPLFHFWDKTYKAPEQIEIEVKKLLEEGYLESDILKACEQMKGENNG